MKNIIKKLTSVKTWVVIFSMFIITVIVFMKLTDFVTLAMLLAGALIAYLPCNIKQKELYKGERKDA